MDEQNPLPVNPSRKSRLGRRYSDHRRPEPAPTPASLFDPASGDPGEETLTEGPANSVAAAAPAGGDPAQGWSEEAWTEHSTPAAGTLEGIVSTEGWTPSDDLDSPQSIADLRARGLQRRRRARPERAKRWRLPDISTSSLLLALVTGAVAGALGYALGRGGNPAPRTGPASAATPPVDASRAAAVPTLDAATAARIDDAFAAFKASRFGDARAAFLAVRDRAPSLRTAGAWNEYFAGNYSQSESQVLQQIRENIDAADAYFLLGLLRATRQDYPGAGQAFAAAAALDPTRAETQFLWGDTLRRDGRPREAIAHFHAAIRRNRQETNESFYQYKLVLSQLEAGGEEAAEVEKNLPSSPEAIASASGFVQLALAAQALSRGQPGVVAERLAAARRALEPALFRIGLQDPIWAAERERPELLEFFR